jgi:hypothetical protein
MSNLNDLLIDLKARISNKQNLEIRQEDFSRIIELADRADDLELELFDTKNDKAIADEKVLQLATQRDNAVQSLLASTESENLLSMQKADLVAQLASEKLVSDKYRRSAKAWKTSAKNHRISRKALKQKYDERMEIYLEMKEKYLKLKESGK